MKINLLNQPQNPYSETILYTPELEIPETDNITEKCYPAVRFSQIYEQEFFLILESELGKYEEYSRYPSKHEIYSYFNGKKGLEQKFQEIYDNQKKWFCTPDAESMGGKFGFRFYKSVKKIYKNDIELSPSPWVYRESLENEDNFFFTSRDQAYPEIASELAKLGFNLY